MQPNANPIPLSPEARAYIERIRPDLASVPLTPESLLTPPPTFPSIPFLPEPEPEPKATPLALGDLLATLLQRLRITSAVMWLQHRGALPIDCGCPARQAYLNTLPARLLPHLKPYPLTLATLIALLTLIATLLLPL